SRLTATASLSRLDMEIAGKTITAVEPLVANWNGSELVIDPTRLKGDYLDLSMSGLVTLDGRPDLRISGSLDMAILKALTTEIEQPAGRTQFELGLQDSFEEPRLKGDITIEEAAFRVKMLNKWVRDLHAHATVNGKMVTMDYLIGMFDEAILDGTGRIGLDGWSPRYLEANLTAAGVELDYPPGVYSAFDADLRAVGKLDELLIDGRVLLDKAVYYQRIDYKSMIVEESQAVLTVQTRAVQGDVREAVGSPRFNVDIMAPDNIFVQNNLADLELKADLTLSGTAAAPLLFGQVSVLGGMVIYEDREFIIDTATIDFIDTKEINPMFDIRANAVIDAYTLGLSVAGKLYGDFTINLNSDPPLSEVDLWSLLVLGKTTDNLKSQGAGYTTAHATSLLTGRIQDEIEKRVKILGGFDEFQITPIVSDSGANAAARFTAKKTIGDRLSVTYSTELSSTSQQLLMVEYQLTDHIVLLGERTETGSLGGNLIFRFALP
ncbi:translocation/assembly module TamB domain-containing protein, partial [bacterium]|nr:translocation/assembly module TamB domain-containing protein [candidate division CSSED10-310 bacterium]